MVYLHRKVLVTFISGFRQYYLLYEPKYSANSKQTKTFSNENNDEKLKEKIEIRVWNLFLV